MQNERSQIIIGRFFLALNLLISNKTLRGKKTFCDVVGCNRRNFYALEHNYASDIFQASWLSVLVVNYHISADWLLTGRGDMLTQ